MENNAIINCTNVIDDNFCTVIVLKYKVYRDDTGKLFGRLLLLKHKVENFLKEVLDEDLLFQNPVFQRAKDGLLDLFQGLTALCSGISPSREMLRVPELAPERDPPVSYEMKFVKSNTPSDIWLCYVDNGDLLNLLKRLSEKHENDELEPFIFFPRIGEHVYFKQGQNIFRGIVQEYVIPDETESEERVDLKIMNMDNSDVVVLPQNCVFQMDKDGVELPMQCILCSLQEVDAGSSTVANSHPLPDLSISMLKKHKLNVTFQRKKVAVKSSPMEAQCVTIDLPVDKAKDKKNGFNVNSKEFVPRNSILSEVSVSSSSASNTDPKSDESDRSSLPGSSQDDVAAKETYVPISDSRTQNQNSNVTATGAASSTAVSAGVTAVTTATASATAPTSTINHLHNKDRVVDNKSNVINYGSTSKNDANSVATTNAFRPPHLQPPSLLHDRERNTTTANATSYHRYGSSKIIDHSASVSKGGKSMSVIVDKLKNVVNISSPSNEARSKVGGGGGAGPPSSSPHPSQTQSPAGMPHNAQMPPYLFIPPGPVHFPGQYVPIPAGAAAASAHPPQQLSSSMPLFLPPYPPTYLPPGAAAAAAAAPPPVSAHSQAAAYHMPPASSHYQPYMQPMAVTPFFSQPPFSQQFYQTSHLQHSWSHLPPSFHIGGGGGGGGGVGLPHHGGGNSGGIGKADLPTAPGSMSSKFK